MVISNRSVITTFYQDVNADGWTAIFHSSQGNEAQTTARETEIGSDVIANNIIVYTAFKPYEGGVEFKQVVCFDPAGMMPGFIKTAICTRMADGLQILVGYLKDGTIPEPIF